MNLIVELRDLYEKRHPILDQIQTEEATKLALIVPFLKALGYDASDPTSVVPEFTADVGIKKGEKVDYAILKDGKPIILFECKKVSANLDTEHFSQLYRYFVTTEASIAVLTNGIEYRFFIDLDSPNKLDQKPFLVVNLAQLDEQSIAELRRFTKNDFNGDSVRAAAGGLKLLREFKRVVGEIFANPDEDFIRLVARRVYSGTLSKNVLTQFMEIGPKAMRQFMSEQVSSRLQSALDRENADHIPSNSDTVDADSSKDEIETTVEELEGFQIVRAILREAVAADRIVARDQKSYFGILLDDNNRKPLARLWFNSASKKYIGLFDNADKKEERVAIERLDDIFKLADRLKATVKFYEG